MAETHTPEPYASEDFYNELMTIGGKNHWPRLQELIFQAEDLQFTAEQGAALAPRLLSLAVLHRRISGPEAKDAVLCAVRIGASMLFPNEAAPLLPLLEPGHAIDTSKVAYKMLRRIYAAFEGRTPDV